MYTTFRFAVSVSWENEVLNNGPIHDHHYYVCCLAKRVGNMFIIIEKQDGSPILIAGPCWPFCMGITVPLILGVSCSIFYFVILNENVGLVSPNSKFLYCLTCASNINSKSSLDGFPSCMSQSCLALWFRSLWWPVETLA
jgi:hypothetical protein